VDRGRSERSGRRFGELMAQKRAAGKLSPLNHTVSKRGSTA
jgi:hypothetical protein